MGEAALCGRFEKKKADQAIFSRIWHAKKLPHRFLRPFISKYTTILYHLLIKFALIQSCHRCFVPHLAFFDIRHLLFSQNTLRTGHPSRNTALAETQTANATAPAHILARQNHDPAASLVVQLDSAHPHPNVAKSASCQKASHFSRPRNGRLFKT